MTLFTQMILAIYFHVPNFDSPRAPTVLEDEMEEA